MLLLGLVVVTGCAGSEDSVQAPAPPRTSLAIEVVVEEGGAPTRSTLQCEPPGGDHPDPEAACADLAAEPEPFAPIPADSVCTEIYGGPQTATVRGTYRGRPVDVALSRVDGCRIAQWERFGALLPQP